jgi:hypothetical protein
MSDILKMSFGTPMLCRKTSISRKILHRKHFSRQSITDAQLISKAHLSHVFSLAQGFKGSHYLMDATVYQLLFIAQYQYK